MRRHVWCLLVCAALPAVAQAQTRWIPYTDGRVGGCWLNSNGYLFGCTPQPPAAPSPVAPRRDPNIITLPSDNRAPQLQRENDALRAARARDQAELRDLKAQREREDRAAAVLREQQRALQQRQFLKDQAARDKKWVSERTQCGSQQYEAYLKSQRLTRHATLAGICVAIDHKPGDGKFPQACPPCDAAK